MPTPPISRTEAERSVREVEQALREGHRPPGMTGKGLGAVAREAQRELTIERLRRDEF